MPIDFRLLLILTATVIPAVPVVRMDPQKRLDDYRDALEHWWEAIRHLPVDIVWVENSGYPTTAITELVNSMGAVGRITALSIPTNAELVRTNGKGAGEALMFDSVAQLYPLERHSHIGKCTGRLWIRNAGRLIEEYSRSGCIAWFAIRLDFHSADTRFFLCTRDFFVSNFLGMAPETNDDRGLYVEHIAARRIHNVMARGVNIGRFPDLPRFHGTGGTDGKRHDSLMGTIRYGVRNTLHRLGIKFKEWIYF